MSFAFHLSKNGIPYSTEIMPTLIACYKAATGRMGLISSFVSKLSPLIKKLFFSVYMSASEACQLLKYNEYINTQQW